MPIVLTQFGAEALAVDDTQATGGDVLLLVATGNVLLATGGNLLIVT